jgi:predicted translin family RNA/ssDNA-binding protein
MKSPKLFSDLKKRHGAREKERRDLIGRSNEALSRSKRAIFAMHRDDLMGAQELLEDANKRFKTIEAKFKQFPDLQYEGAYRAALEEYAEALLFQSYLEHHKLGKIDARAMEPGIYLAGLSDTTGEIVRYAMRQVTSGNTQAVEDAREVVAMVIEMLLDMDLTGYLRTKFDQAKKNYRRLEEMVYDLSLRKG